MDNKKPKPSSYATDYTRAWAAFKARDPISFDAGTLRGSAHNEYLENRLRAAFEEGRQFERQQIIKQLKKDTRP